MKTFNLSIVFVFCTAVLMFTYQNCTSEVTFSEVEYSSEVVDTTQTTLAETTQTTKRKPYDPCADLHWSYVSTEEECMALSNECDGALGGDGVTPVPFFACMPDCGHWRPTCYRKNCEESGVDFGIVGCGGYLNTQDGTKSAISCAGRCRI